MMVFMKTQIFAHRGASKEAPENTMPAFELAYEQGSDGIETDVQLTKDNIPVLIHDEWVDRTSNAYGRVADYTYKELSTLDAGSWFQKIYKNTNIPSLDTFLGWASKRNVRINLELKTNVYEYFGIEKIVYDYVKHYNMLNKVLFSSFNSETLTRLLAIDSTLQTAFLTSTNKNENISIVQSNDYNGINVKYRLLTQALIQKAHAAHINVGCFTINRPSHMLRCFQLGCDILFTDLPNLAIETRELYEQNIIY